MAIFVWLIALPAISIAWAWSRLGPRPAGSEASPNRARLALILTTASALLFCLGMVRPDLIGGDYSSRRYVTIGVNLALMGLVTVAGAVARPRLPFPVILSSALTGALWLYVAMVSSAV